MVIILEPKKMDVVFIIILILILIGLPLGIRAYDRHLKPKKNRSEVKEFTLTGNTEKGWVLGDVQANDIISLWRKPGAYQKPVIKVTKGDQVMLKLRSSDVTHGFSLKAYGIYMAKGIKPGRTVFFTFKADKVGIFVFRCNVFCGDIHQYMVGKLIVGKKGFSPDAR